MEEMAPGELCKRNGERKRLCKELKKQRREKNGSERNTGKITRSNRNFLYLKRRVKELELKKNQ